MITPLTPGSDALLFLTRPLRVRAVRVGRVWRSVGGAERVEVIAHRDDGGVMFRPGQTFDRRQFLSVAALENLSAPAVPGSPADKQTSAEASGANLSL